MPRIVAALILIGILAEPVRVVGYYRGGSTTVHHVSGGGRYGYHSSTTVVHHDHYDSGWGSFAAGAAIGTAAGIAIGAATAPRTTVVAVPPVGTVVQALPAGCAMVAGPAGQVYNCNSVYYQPYYQGSVLCYRVTTL
jgi:hypothetical protein